MQRQFVARLSWLASSHGAAGFGSPQVFGIAVLGDSGLKMDERWGDMVPLSDEDRKESLSLAWLAAMAAVAGLAWEVPRPDRDSIDVTLSALGPGRPKMDVQLKATANAVVRDDGLHYRLSGKNYNDLRHPNRMVPLILVVVQLPLLEKRWIDVKDDRMVLRRRAWWASYRGARRTKGQSKTVVVPKDQRLDVDVLIELMGRARDREL